jgi:hypothetical protein
MRLKNEVTVGLVVLAGIALLVVGALWLSNTPWAQDQRELRAIFEEVGELGLGIGLAARGQGVLVEMEIDPDVVMPPQPGVVLAPASLFGEWQANLITMSEMPDLVWTSAQGARRSPTSPSSPRWARASPTTCRRSPTGCSSPSPSRPRWTSAPPSRTWRR